MHSYKKKIGFLFNNSNVLLNYLPVIHLHFPTQNGERDTERESERASERDVKVQIPTCIFIFQKKLNVVHIGEINKICLLFKFVILFMCTFMCNERGREGLE